MNSEQPREDVAARTRAWWAAVLAGRVEEPHPVHGFAIHVHLRDGLLRVRGELESRADRASLVREAKSWVGLGIDGVDASGLTVTNKKEKPGILHQTLIAAFANAEVAKFALSYVIDHSRVVAKQQEIVDSKHPGTLRKFLPEGFIADAQRALEAGQTVLILRVDETDAFRVRALLEEDTRSIWTIASPPSLSLEAQA